MRTFLIVMVLLVVLMALVVGVASASGPGPIAVVPGDANHDGHVNALDLSLVAQAYGSTITSPNWNPNADLNLDGRVNLFDLVIVGMNYLRY